MILNKLNTFIKFICNLKLFPSNASGIEKLNYYYCYYLIIAIAMITIGSKYGF